MSKTALIAMSGGVDSSVAAHLMKLQGFECIGVTMKLFNHPSDGADDARNAARKLGIPHYVIDLSDDFEKYVIKRFIEIYQSGETPNPCVLCNRHIKFGRLQEYAKKNGADYIVTGHYARVGFDAARGRHILRKALDESKDQSYVLYSLSQEQFARVMFPLGMLAKTEIRAIALEQGLANADKRDSQDICFVPGGDYARFIEQRTGHEFESGNFIDIRGNVLGRHKGHIRYTIGQRKGLGLAGRVETAAFTEPLYVQSKDAQHNTVTLCGNEELFTKAFEAVDFNWVAYDKSALPPHSPIRAKARVRYKHSEQWASVRQMAPGMVRIEFDEPQRAIAKGQAVVLYDGDIVLGGGTIA